MIRYFLFLSVFFIFTMGCATHHYYDVKNEELHIYLKKPKTKEVYLLCSLDEYKPRPAINTGSGVWESVLPSDMEFNYFFLVDGEVFIPACEMKEKDDFGSENCVYIPLMGNQ